MSNKHYKRSKKISLEEKLNKIYYGTINLDTTCNGNIVCCKTACPSMNHSEFLLIINKIWDSISKSEKIELICKSIEYFFHNEFSKFGKDIFYKPCLLLNENGKCSYYKQRPLNCRLYGLWPEGVYKTRVDKFEKAYEGLIKREELPLNVQCPNVKRVDDAKPLTEDIINGLFSQLDKLDTRTGNFSELQINQKENYRTFHDWLLFKIFGESWLVELTRFMMAADKNIIEDQIVALKKAVREGFAKNMPDL